MTSGPRVRQRRNHSDTESGQPAINGGVQDGNISSTTPPQEDGELDVHLRNFTADDQHNWKRFNNPFHNWSEPDVDRIAKQLAKLYGAEKGLFVRAARVLHQPNLVMWNDKDIPGLTEPERKALTKEKAAGFFDQPWPLQTTFLVLFVAATVQGWNQTGTTGANLGWPQELLFNSEPVDSMRPDRSLNANCVPSGHNKWIFAAVNAMPYFAAGIGTFLSDFLNEMFFGRRNAILFSAIVIFAAAIGSAFVKEWTSLLGLRALLGIGMGCKAAVVPVFAAEIAPAHLRGSLVMNWQVFDALGIFLGYTANLVVSRTSTPWRWQLASSCIPTFALICGVLFVRWDSPRFLMKREQQNKEWHSAVLHRRNEDHSDLGQNQLDRLILVPDCFYYHMPVMLRKHLRPITTDEYCSPAFQTLVLLRGHPILAAKELIFAHCQLLIEIYTYPSRKNDDPSELQEMQIPRGQPNTPSTPPTPGIRPENSSVQADSSTSSNAVDRDEADVVTDAGSRINPTYKVEVSLTHKDDRTKWFTRVGHVRNANMRYLAREVIAASVVMISQQLCGINVLIFYSASMFCNPGEQNSSSLQPLLLSWGIGLTNVMFALPAYRWIETMGRKWLMLATLPVLSLLIGAAAASLKVPHVVAQQVLVGFFTYFFTAVYSFGMGPVPFTYSAEIFPLEHRIIGMSIAVSINFLGAGILAFFVPILQIGSILLAVFAGLNICAFVAVWKWVPETIAAAPHDDDETPMTALDLSQLFYIFRRQNWIYGGYMKNVYSKYFRDSIWAILTFKTDEIKQPKAFHHWSPNEHK